MPIRLHQSKKKDMCERLAKHKRTRSSLYIDTQNYDTFATRKMKGTLSELAAQMGGAKSPPHFCKYSTTIFRAL